MEGQRVHHGKELIAMVASIKAGLPTGWEGYVSHWLKRSPDPEIAAFGERLAAIVSFPEDRPGTPDEENLDAA